MSAEALAPMDVAARAQRLLAQLEGAGCDALLVTNLTNVRYLTGFTGSAGMVAMAPGRMAFFTDGRYQTQAPEELEAAGVDAEVVIVSSSAAEDVGAVLGGFARVGLESTNVTWARQRDIAESWLPSAELVPTKDLVEELRLVKDPGELARLELAAAIADEALAKVRPHLAEGATEREVAFELEVAMRDGGADGLSFETIVASGPNGARPHAHPTDRRITDGDLVVIDFGALVDGYHSDMTRTIAVGDISPTQQRMLDVVTEAQQAGVDVIRAGATAAEVDAACREVIDEAGWLDSFVHATGHGVGLDIHEDPRVATTSDATLAERFVVTVEPGVYLPEHGGVRVEDTVVVTADGCRALTRATKATTV